VLEQFIQQAVDAADEISRAANLRFIAFLVAVQQEGVRTNQEAVVDAMLRGTAPLFPKILVGEREGIDVALPLPGPAGARVAAAARGSGEDARARAPAVALRVLYRDALAHGGQLAVLEAALRLLTALCAGCDPDTRALVGGPHRLVSFDALLLGIEDGKLPPRARAQLARLMQALFVGRPPADQLPARLSTHLLHDADPGQLQLPGPVFEVPKQFRGFKPVREVAVRVLAAAKRDARGGVRLPPPEEEEEGPGGSHALNLAVAALCETMLALGLFSGVEELQMGLIPALAAHLDAPAPEAIREELDTKVVVCRALLAICDLRLRVRLPLLLGVFKQVTSETKGSESPDLEVRRMTEQLVSAANEDMHKLLSFLSFSSTGADGQAVAHKLVRLIGAPRSDLALFALQLLLRERSPRLELFRELANTQVAARPPQPPRLQRARS
jgi:hypothetical protein